MVGLLVILRASHVYIQISSGRAKEAPRLRRNQYAEAELSIIAAIKVMRYNKTNKTAPVRAMICLGAVFLLEGVFAFFSIVCSFFSDLLIFIRLLLVWVPWGILYRGFVGVSGAC